VSHDKLPAANSSDSEICTVDYHTGRVMSIGGLPWPPIRKAPMRANFVICFVVAVLLFVFVGLAQAAPGSYAGAVAGVAGAIPKNSL